MGSGEGGAGSITGSGAGSDEGVAGSITGSGAGSTDDSEVEVVEVEAEVDVEN